MENVDKGVFILTGKMLWIILGIVGILFMLAIINYLSGIQGNILLGIKNSFCSFIEHIGLKC